jgi:hypothetical protein
MNAKATQGCPHYYRKLGSYPVGYIEYGRNPLISSKNRIEFFATGQSAECCSPRSYPGLDSKGGDKTQEMGLCLRVAMSKSQAFNVPMQYCRGDSEVVRLHVYHHALSLIECS